jgi:hypothetical protein
MSKPTLTGPGARDGSEWNHAWAAVARLAAAHEALITTDPTSRVAPDAAPVDRLKSTAASPAPVTSDQLARAIGDIERAAAALRHQEPSLEPGRSDAAEIEADAAGELDVAPSSVWTLVAGIWIFAVLVVCGTIGAIVLIVS